MPMRFKDKIEGTITNADYASSAGAVAWGNVTGKPSTFTPSTHTHNYAGSGSAGGSANSAVKLDTATAGSTNQPVYFAGGKPVAIGFTIQSNVPANAKFTDTNTTYNVFKAATASAAGGTGLVPAPAAGAQGKYLRADGTWSSPPNDNTTYSDFAGATADAAGANGLVPAPAKGQQNYFLRGDKTWQALSKSSVGLGNVDNTADSAKSVKYATSAGSANSVAWGSVSGKPTTFAPAAHTHKYASGFSVSGTTVTVTYGDGTSSTFKTQDTNNTYGVFKGATADAAGGTGLVPAPAKGAEGYYLAGDSTWKAFSKYTVGLGNVDNTADSAKSVKYATSAGSANSVAWGSVSGKPTTFAPSAHTHNYAGSASAGGSATSAVAVVDYGSTAKTIQIGYGGDGITGDSIKYIAGYTAGDGANVTAKIKDVSKDALRGWLGLGSAAYTASSNYAASSHTHNYAGSASAGGSANSAVKLDTATAGSSTQPVYFSNGKPTACTYTLGKSVPSNAVFTDTVTLTLADRVSGKVVTCDAIPTT